MLCRCDRSAMHARGSEECTDALLTEARSGCESHARNEEDSGAAAAANGRAGEDVGGRVGVDSMASLKNWANRGDKAKGLLTETRLSRRCNDGGQAAQAMESGRGGGGQGRPIRDGCQEGVWLCRAMWLAELECKAARIDVGAQPTQVLQS
jgi:hypothetical protein